MSALLQILRLWRGRAGWLLAGLLVSWAALAAAVALMTLSGALLAAALGGGVLAIPLLLRLVGPLRVGLRYTERLLTHAATFRALADLRVWFFRGLAGQAGGGLGFRRSGDLVARLANDVEALDGLYLRLIVPLAGATLLLLAIVGFVVRHDAVLAASVGCLFALAAFGVPALAARLAARQGTALAEAGAGLRIATLDAITGLREVRSFGAEARFQDLIAEREGVLLTVQRRIGHRGAWAGGVAFVIMQTALLLVLVRAGHRPAFAVATLFLLVAAFETAGGLARAGVLAGHAAAAARRVLDIANGPNPYPDPASPAAAPLDLTIRFDSVRFVWQADRPAVFDGLDLTIPFGARVALLGPSGAGKSSLVALLLRVVRPDGGRITLGGVDLASLPASAVRSRIAWLSQATHLFDDTIRANLLLGRPGADDAACWAALDAAAIGDFVRGLPDGLDSWVGEGGTRFSGGQARRLVLARALISTAPILILDEPAAGLDGETERQFLTTLNDIGAGRTVILIAHRLTGVERVDRIWRLSGGTALAAAA